MDQTGDKISLRLRWRYFRQQTLGHLAGGCKTNNMESYCQVREYF